MNYCFSKTRQIFDRHGEPCGCEPDFIPEDAPNIVMSYLLLADARGSEWSLYQYSVDDNEDWQADYPVNQVLQVLLASAERFPPAMALMKEYISTKFKSGAPDLEIFTHEIERALCHFLLYQQKNLFAFAPSTREELYYLSKGEWCWILGYDKSASSVFWVSDDYSVYCNPVEDFDLTDAQRQTLLPFDALKLSLP